MTSPLYPLRCDCGEELTTETTAVLGDDVGCVACMGRRASDMLANPGASEAEVEDAREILGWQAARGA